MTNLLVTLLALAIPFTAQGEAQRFDGYLIRNKANWILKKDPANLSGQKIRWRKDAPPAQDGRICRSLIPADCTRVTLEARLNADGTGLEDARLLAESQRENKSAQKGPPNSSRSANDLLELLKARP